MEAVNIEFVLTSQEAVSLTHKAQEALTHDIYFAQTLMTASPEHIEALRTLVFQANYLRANKMNESQEEIHRGIKLTDRAMRRSAKEGINPSSRFRRVFRIRNEQEV